MDRSHRGRHLPVVPGVATGQGGWWAWVGPAVGADVPGTDVATAPLHATKTTAVAMTAGSVITLGIPCFSMNLTGHPHAHPADRFSQIVQ